MEMSQEWKDHIAQQMEEPYMKELYAFVKERRTKAMVLPEGPKVFEAFLLCPYHYLKIVIIGNEPSDIPEQASGLAYSCENGTKNNAINNIFKEIFQDEFNGNTGGISIDHSGNLSPWARQGVLLLNTVLTVESGKPKSHAGKGWETFTENTIKFINKHRHKLVFILWGKQAQEYAKYIDEEKHLMLKADHPASAGFKADSFFGCRHFSKANQWIKKHYFNVKPPINWATIKLR